MSNLYLSYDGDDCGKKVGKAIIADDEVGLREISAKIDLGHEIVNHWVVERGGSIISGGGDEGAFKLPQSAKDQVEQLRKDYNSATGITMSVGIGSSLSEAGRALLAAKFRGKDQIATFDDSVEKDIETAKKRVRNGKASQEEYKLSEAYLEKSEGEKMEPKAELQDCQYCAQTDGVDPDHCKYCHDEQAQTEDNCPYCKEADASVEDDCPYCKEATVESDDCPYCKEASPDSSGQEAPAGSNAEKEQQDAEKMGMNPPVIGKPEMGDSSPAGIGAANPSDAGAPIAQEAGSPPIQADEHSKDAMIAIVEAIEGQDSNGNQLAEQIDDTDLAIGDEHQDGVSRPSGYDEQNVPGDMGLAEDEVPQDEPDLSEVLHEGLDSHADGIQKEKVVQLVSSALEEFKGCKDILDKAQQQAPRLYSASIAMLKAMIEMADMLGLSQQGSTQAIDDQAEEVIGGAGENEWHDPFPKHPDQGGEHKPGHHAPAIGQEKEGATIGQPIGKLSAKHTTKHVARATMPPGAVNAKGQQKVIDPKTGKARWIDRKQGMVQSPTGVPIKPPSQGGDA